MVTPSRFDFGGVASPALRALESIVSKTISNQKRLANRQNGLKSTGPRTAAGKAVAAGNAMRHGVFAQRLLLPGEDSAELRRLKCGIVRRLNPRDAVEMNLVERVVVGIWKLRRLQQIERCLYLQKSAGWEPRLNDLENYGLDAQQTVPVEAVWTSCYPEELDRMERLEKQEHRLENSLSRTLRQLAALRKEDPTDALSALADDVLQQEESAEACTPEMPNEATASDSNATPEEQSTDASDGSIDVTLRPEASDATATRKMPNEATASEAAVLPKPADSTTDAAATNGSRAAACDRPRCRAKNKDRPTDQASNASANSRENQSAPFTARQRSLLHRLRNMSEDSLGQVPLHELSVQQLQHSAAAPQPKLE